MKKLKLFISFFTLCSTSAFAATVHTINPTFNGDPYIDAVGWATADQFVGSLDDPGGVTGYPIRSGDSVNMHIDFLDNASLRLTANDTGDSSLGFMLRRPDGAGSLWEIENVSVTLHDFSTNGSSSGTLSAASQSFSGSALGPFFQQAELGVADGQFIMFSGFDVSYDVVSINPSSSDYTWTADVANNWTVETVSAVPLPAAAWLFGSAVLGLIGAARRRKR